MSNFIDQLNEAYIEGVKGTKSDRDKADINDDGDIDGYEKKKANAIRKSQGKEHLCATKVEHTKYGVGTPISERHGEPNDEGHVSWYAITFEHGTEVIDTVNLKILDEMNHGHKKK